jgi:hypothetical protein
MPTTKKKATAPSAATAANPTAPEEQVVNGEGKSSKPKPPGRMHGGSTPKGIASPQFRNGLRSRYLKHLPATLQAGYQASMEDPELLSMRAEIAMLDARSNQLLEELASGEGPTFEDVRRAMLHLDACSEEDTAEALAHLREAIREGAAGARRVRSVWREMREIYMERATLAQTESNILHATNAVVSAEDALVFVRMVLAAIREVVTDRKMLATVQEKLLAFMPRPESE